MFIYVIFIYFIYVVAHSFIPTSNLYKSIIFVNIIKNHIFLSFAFQNALQASQVNKLFFRFKKEIGDDIK